MTTWKLAPALAAGCAVVLKPDPQTPVTALRLAELAAGSVSRRCDQPRHRRRPETGAYLVRHPGVDKVAVHRLDEDRRRDHAALLGSDQAPDARARGQGPNLVFADADLDSAIPSAVWSIYYAAGQSCEARSRVLVEQSIYDDFVSAFTEKAGQLKVGDPLDAETQMGSLISKAPERVHSFVEGAREEGGEVVLGGEPGEARVLSATVVAGVESSSTIAQEEVFGPVVTIIPFEDEKDAIKIANDVRYGLMASVWTGDPARGHRPRFEDQGGNGPGSTCPTAFPGLPFGGYKQSGFGRELGIEALDLYLETKSVTVNTGSPDQPLRPLDLARYPLGGAGGRRRASFSTVSFAIAVLAPALREEYGLA